jgi:lipoyl(octanoyl) transferase
MQLQYDYAHKTAIFGPRLFFMQHPPTVTLGRHADPASLKLNAREYACRGIEVIRVKRGGDVTFHGPGQLVGYPVASLDSASCSVPDWVRGHAQSIVRFLGCYGIRGIWSDTHPGVWVAKEKIAALGFHIFRRVSTHGFALNVKPDLSHFETIVPCGVKDLGITSMDQLGATAPDMQEASGLLAKLIADTFGWTLGERLSADPFLEDKSNAYATKALVS